MKNNLFLLLFPVLALLSCDTTQKAQQTPTEPQTMTKPSGAPGAPVTPVSITYKKGPCMGKCPVFTMDIDETGKVTFNGRKFTNKDGQYTKMLTREELNALHLQVTVANFMSLDDSYDSGILDAPTTTIIARSSTREKKVTFRGKMPDDVKPLRDLLDKIYLSEGWTEVAPPADTSRAFGYSQGPCFGRCPVYTLDISKGNAVYVGKRFADKQGEHHRAFTEAEAEELAALFEAADFFSLDNKYDSGISDISTRTLSYRKGDMVKEISLRGNTPEKVKPILKYMQNLAKGEGWKKVASNDYGLPTGTIADELIVKLKKDADIKALLSAYSKQNLQLKKTLVQSMNMHLLSFDPNTMTPQEMIESVGKEEAVDTVEFNKELQGRD